MDSLSPPTQILVLLPLAAASEEAAAVDAPPVEAAAVTEAALLDRHAAQLARLEVATASSWCGGARGRREQRRGGTRCGGPGTRHGRRRGGTRRGGPGAREQGGGTGAWPPYSCFAAAAPCPHHSRDWRARAHTPPRTYNRAPCLGPGLRLSPTLTSPGTKPKPPAS